MKSEDEKKYASIFTELENHFKFMTDDNLKLVQENSRLIEKNNKLVNKIKKYKQFKIENDVMKDEISELKKTICDQEKK